MGLRDDIEKCFENGWTDGLPVVPPYGSLVDEMVDSMGWKPTEVVATLDSVNLEVRAEQLAAAAVMAGCSPAYGKILRAISLAMLDKRFDINGVAITTGGVGVLVVVSGPVVREFGFANGVNALGATERSNQTIGRFANMVRLFCGRAGILEENGTIGHPGRISFLIAEHDDCEWGSFHGQLNIPSKKSFVTVMAAEAPNSVNNHYANTGKQVLETIASCMCHLGATNFYYQGVYRSHSIVVVLAHDHKKLVTESYTLEDARRFLFERIFLQTKDLQEIGRIPKRELDWSNTEIGPRRAPMVNENQILFLESGGPVGGFSAVIPLWVANHTIIREIED